MLGYNYHNLADSSPIEMYPVDVTLYVSYDVKRLRHWLLR